MKFDIYKALYTLLIGLLGYFLRDVYNWTKRKLIKGVRPKLSIKYTFRHTATLGTHPRMYTFESLMVVQNIDTRPIYNIVISRQENGELTEIESKELLSSTEKIEIKDSINVPFGDIGSKRKEAEKELKESFKDPHIIVSYEDENGHKYKKVKKTEPNKVQ